MLNSDVICFVMKLTKLQKREFYEQGYLKIEGAIPKLMLNDALRAINHSIGAMGIPPEELPRFRQTSYCQEVQKTPAITDLFNRSAVYRLIESLLGEGNVESVSTGQLALRFPEALGEDVSSRQRGHIDGLGTGLNGSQKGEYSRSFTGLCVVLLSDLPEGNSGNFTVWPKSHRVLEKHFQEHGHEVLSDGMPKVDLPEGPVQTTGKAGDVILAHHLLVHSAGLNDSPHIRYASIFRVHHKDRASIDKDAYTDMWREWPGVREILSTE